MPSNSILFLFFGPFDALVAIMLHFTIRRTGYNSIGATIQAGVDECTGAKADNLRQQVMNLNVDSDITFSFTSTEYRMKLPDLEVLQKLF